MDTNMVIIHKFCLILKNKLLTLIKKKWENELSKNIWDGMTNMELL